MPALLDYTDYRLFLKDWYTAKKTENRNFSLRIWAEKVGFKARDYLLRVMQGDRNLSQDGIIKLSEYFRFSEKQRRYFGALVRFNQADNQKEKETAWRELAQVQKFGSSQKLRLDQFDFYSSWHHAALRSLLPVLPRGTKATDWESLGKLLDPPLSAKQVRDSVEMMVRLGLLQDQGRGRYAVSRPGLTTGDEIASVAVGNFHKTIADLAKRSIDRHPAPSRDISGVTMSLSNRGFRRIKSELAAFRKRVMEIAAEDRDEDLVYQLSLHFFPLTRTRGSA